jgi:hypothetical protein
MANGTFGLMSPELMQQALQQEQQKGLMAQANMDPAAYLRYSAGMRGAQAGRDIGSLLGIEDPRLKQARDAQEAYNEALQLSGGDATTADFFKAFANSAARRNLPDLALQATTQASQVAPKRESPFTKIDITKFTPESVQSFIDAGATDSARVLLKAKEEEKPAEQRVRETRINELVTRGYTQQFATDIVDGNIRYEVVPQTGNVRRIDRLTGSVAEVPINNLPPQEQAALLAAEEESEKQTLWDAAEQGTGAWSSLRAGASRAFGQIPGVPQAQKTEEARQFLFSATNDLARSLVNNPRFPVAEVERVIREAGTQPSAFDTPELLRSRLKVLDGFLRDRLKTAEQDAANANLPQDVRVAQATNAASIRAFLPKLGVPEQGIGKPPRGVTMEQWRAMTPAQRDLFKSK